MVICVQKNQCPSKSQFLCLFFETLNSRNESGFKKINQEAREGKISRRRLCARHLEIGIRRGS